MSRVQRNASVEPFFFGHCSMIKQNEDHEFSQPKNRQPITIITEQTNILIKDDRIVQCGNPE